MELKRRELIGGASAAGVVTVLAAGEARGMAAQSVPNDGGEWVSTGGDRVAVRWQNTAGTNTPASEFRLYATHIASNVPADPIDDVWGFGFNVLANGQPLDNSKPSFVQQFERIFAQSPNSTDGGFEWFIQGLYPSGTFPSGGRIRRPFGMFVEHGLGNTIPTAVGTFALTTLTFSRFSDTALRAKWDLAGNDFDLVGTRLRWENNIPLLRAWNGARTSVETLVTFTPADRLLFGAPLTVSSAARSDPLVSNITSLVTLNCSSGLNDGDALVNVFGPTKTNAYYMLHLRGSSSDRVANRIVNNGTGAAQVEVEGKTFAAQLFTGPNFAWVMQGLNVPANEYRVTAYNNLTNELLFSIHRSTKRVSYRGPLNLNVASLVNAANDSAAAAAGVPVGDVYRNGSVLMVRVS